MHPPQLHQLYGLSFPWEVGRGSLRGTHQPPRQSLRPKPNPPVGAQCCSDGEQMYVWAGIVWDGQTLQREVCSSDEGVLSLGCFFFLLQGKRYPLCNAAADEVTSLFLGTLERSGSGLFLSC